MTDDRMRRAALLAEEVAQTEGARLAIGALIYRAIGEPSNSTPLDEAYDALVSLRDNRLGQLYELGLLKPPQPQEATTT